MAKPVRKSVILKEAVADDLKPLRKGGVTFYPAGSLERIFEWAADAGRTLEWVEGVFYRPDTHEGQLSLGYICERRGGDYATFRETCLSLIDEIKIEASGNEMSAYFEIGIST